jgi:hypothetical protein
MEETACSALSKSLNYVVVPGRIPVKDFLCDVGKAIRTLSEETAEEIRQETFCILNGSSQPKDNLTGAERIALRPLKPMISSPNFRGAEYFGLQQEDRDSQSRHGLREA